MNSIRSDKVKNAVLFPSIDNAEDMLDYLKDSKRVNTGLVYQYTRLESLGIILTSDNPRWKFNKPEKMNDHFEYERFNNQFPGCWSGKYYGCFMKTDTESVAMWSMYGQPWEEGVRIGIHKADFKRWASEITIVYDDNGNEITNPICAIGDVLYITENRSDGIVLGNNTRNTLLYPYDWAELAGYAKDKAWDYEKEIRLHVDVRGYYGNSVYVPIPDYILQNMVITVGPRFKPQHVLKELTKGRNAITESVLKGKLRWVYCDTCLESKEHNRNEEKGKNE